MALFVGGHSGAKTFVLFQILLILIFGGVTMAAVQADIVLRNGKIWTVNPRQPQARALVILGNRILFVGSDEEAAAWIGPRTRVIDLQGRLTLPGFNDAHVHFSDGGFLLIGLKLRDAPNREEFARRIGEYVKKLPPDVWVTGGDWDHENWPDKRYPDRWLIDPVTAENPVLVYRLDGHVALANTLALKLAHISASTPDPAGGYIEKDPRTGEPTGILKDTAIELVSKIIPPPPDSLRMRAIRAALRHCAELGITSIQDMSAEHDFPLYQELQKQDVLTVRILAAMPLESHLNLFKRLRIHCNFGNSFLRIGSLKLFSDGSMGAGSALFFAPYSDDPSTAGLAIYPKEELVKRVIAAYRENLQLCTHAIGDRANRWVLDAYEEAIKKFGSRDLRPRIEHAQVVSAADLPRFAQLGVVASIQPSHCIDDMRWAEKRIGKERCADAYRFRSFYKHGAMVAFGTDWPVETLNPMVGLYAAVTREFPEGGPEGGWIPEEKITLEQAIWSYTYGSAYAEHAEQEKGSLEAGKLADLIVLDRDLFHIPPREILQARVLLTMVDGKIVYERK